MNAASRRTPLLLGIAGLSLGSVAVALWTQHSLGMEPCPWCVLQRLIFVVIALVALLGLAWRGAAGTLITALLMIALSLSGVAAALWQHFVAAASDSCKLTLAERIISGLGLDGSLPEVFQPRASCADAAVNLLGLPYEFWSLGLFVLLGLMTLVLLGARRR
ncbi:MAG: disulfide bond formation protein [Proteobacteria bacterium]|nr:disulfide bond formation protein [Pseudomonadota bacterium]